MKCIWLPLGLLLIQFSEKIICDKRIKTKQNGDAYNDYYEQIINERDARYATSIPIANNPFVVNVENYNDVDVNTDVNDHAIDNGNGTGDDVLQMMAKLECPLGCVCQYAYFDDLPISRWINYMQMRPKSTTTQQQQYLKHLAEMSIRRTPTTRPIQRKRNSNSNSRRYNGQHIIDAATTATKQTNSTTTTTIKTNNATAYSRRRREIKQQHNTSKYNYNNHNYYNNKNNINNLNEVTYETEEHENIDGNDNSNANYRDTYSGANNNDNKLQQIHNINSMQTHTEHRPLLIRSLRTKAFVNASPTYVEEEPEEMDEADIEKSKPFVVYDDHKLNVARKIKQATCILQEDTIVMKLMRSLPNDLEALILLYTGIGQNKTVNVSALKMLPNLKTLEIRGLQDRTLKLVFDEPLHALLHANFESIQLLRGDNIDNRPRDVAHPSDSYNYKPKSEFILNVVDDPSTKGWRQRNETYDERYDDDSINGKRLDFQPAIPEIEILPYHVYMQRMKEARMPTFYGWSALQVLRIHACQLRELYWEMFDGLDGLQHLSLERNDIEILPPFALYGALHIKTLSLSHNRLRELHYRGLAGLLELNWLDLSDNRLSWLSERSFPPFPNLQRIDFTNNPIKSIYPAAFWVMNETREMIFNSKDVALELWNDAPFGSLRELRDLSIGNISLSNLEQNVFKGLRALHLLRLRGMVKSIDFDAFSSLITLQELDLNYCHIEKLSMDAFIGCKNLEIIHLAHNALTYMPPGIFDDQTRLKEIYLDGNRLKTLPSNFFLLPQLKLARLNDNPWQCTCAMQNWRSSITNQQRGETLKRCITDFRTGEEINCKFVDNLQFNRSLAPRCDNFNGRSIFYVLRKQLQCGPGRIIVQHHQQHATTIVKNINSSAVHSKDEIKQLNGNKVINNNNNLQNQRRDFRQQKQRRNKSQLNTLAYILHQRNQQYTSSINTKRGEEKESIEMSNNI